MRALIGETWRLVRTARLRLLVTTLLLLAPAELAVAYARWDSENVRLVAELLISLVGYPWVSGALYLTLHRQVRPPEAYGATVDRLWAIVVLNVVVVIPLFVAFLLLIVPGLLLAARWSVAGPLVVLDRRGPLAALEASNAFVRGKTWSVVGAGLVVTVASVLLAVPGVLVIALITHPAGDALGSMMVDLALFPPLAAFSYAVFRQAQAV